MPESKLKVLVFDGSRQALPANLKPLITIADGNGKVIFRDDYSSGTVFGVPFYDNFGDNYSVLAYLDGYKQAGFMPVQCSPDTPRQIDIMLLKRDAGYNFADAKWGNLKNSHPTLFALLAAGADDASAAARYDDLLENRSEALACFLNITTAMAAIQLPQGTPFDYFKELVWDQSMAQDRFFAYADPAVYDQVKVAAAHGEFAREVGFAIFHEGATDSYKQIQFGEANVQLTFHANDTKLIGDINCIKIEPDIDYYKDLLAHGLLEIVTNSISGSLTDPRQVYVLRWIAGRHAGVPEFNPPYTIV